MQPAKQDTWWQRLGGPNAITLGAWLLTLPGAMLSPVATSSGSLGGRWILWVLLGFVAHVLCGAVLFIAGKTVLPCTTRASRPWTFVLVVAFAGLIRGVFMAIAAFELGLAGDLNLGLRLTSAPGTFLLWYSLATLIVDGTRRHRATMALLREQLDQEQEIAESSVQFIANYRADIVQRTQQVVVEQLSQAQGSSQNPEVAALKLQGIVNEVVRPLSHELERRNSVESQVLEEAIMRREPTRISVAEYASAIVTAQPFNAGLTGLLIFGSIAYLMYLTLGPAQGTVGLVATVGVSWALSSLIHQFAMPALRELRVGVRVIGVVVLWIVIAGLTTGVLTAITAWFLADEGGVPTDPFAAIFAMSFLVVLICEFAGAVVGAVSAMRTRAEEELRSSASALEWATSRLRQRAFLEQQELSRVLHGDVQARIVSLALQIQINPPSDLSASIAELEADVRKSLRRDHRVGWREEFADVEELWSFAIALNVQLQEPASVILDTDPVVASAVAWVVREAITNAVRHGNAERVDVWIRPGTNAIVVDVVDDGSGMEVNIVEGMGTRLLDAVCFEWSIETQQATTLHAVFPCSTTTQRSEVLV